MYHESFQRLETVLCFIGVLILLKGLKKVFINKNGVCGSQWDNSNWNARMNNMQEIMMTAPSLRLAMHMATTIKIKERTTKHIWIHVIPDMQQKDP